MKEKIYQNTKVKHFLGFVLFILLAAGMFSNITYLFRNTGYDRNHVIGIKSEEKNIDVVYIGGSAAFVYWEPLRAFNDCGFTSYDLATNSIGVENILPYVQYAEKYQNPELYVIGIRAFQYYSDDQNEQGLRNASDGMDISLLPRYEMVSSYISNRNMDENADLVSFYLDVAKYHTNYSNLANQNAWSFINNNGISPYKGCEITGLPGLWTYLETPKDYVTEERTPLLPNAQKEMDKLLSYCDEKKLNVLFVVCPYAITKDHYAIYNTVKDQVTARGYGFLNANDYYDEMGIDFATDFYNGSHVNLYGADKYTTYLENYITSNYELPDHREDAEYADWNEAAIGFYSTDKQMKEETSKMISDADWAISRGESIRNTSDFSTWCSYVKDTHYSLIMAGNGCTLITDSYIDKKNLEYLGLDLNELYGTDNFIKVISDDVHRLVMPEIVDSCVTVPVGQYYRKSNVSIDNRAGKGSIVINGKEYSMQDAEGVNVVVLDNYYGTVIDSVTLKKQDDVITILR